MSVAKTPINVLLAQPSNMWPRHDTNFDFIVLHYVGADTYNGINGSFGSAVQVRTTSY